MTEIQVQQTIGQLEASIHKAEPFLSQEEFEEYCDAIYTNIAYWRKILKKIKNSNEIKETNEIAASTNWEER